MKIPQVVLGAVLAGLAVQTISCTNKTEPTGKSAPTVKQEPGPQQKPAPDTYQDACPACGMG